MDKTISIRTKKGSIRRPFEWLRSCAEGHPLGYDLAILPRWDQDDYGCAAQCFLLGAQWIVGHRQAGRADRLTVGAHSDHLITQAVECSAGHEVERSFRLLEAIGIPSSTKTNRIHVSQGVQNDVGQWLARRGVQTNDQIVALGIGAGESKRIWPVARFAELATQLNNAGKRLICLGGATDADTAHCLEAHGCVNATALPSIKHTLALLNLATLFVGNDSGPMHIAAAQGVPVIEISCHSEGDDPSHPNAPERFAPWGVRSVVLRPKSGQTIADIPVTSVIDAIAALELMP